MDTGDKCYELENIVSSLDILIMETNDRDWVNEFKYLKYKAQDELQKANEDLKKEVELEHKERNREYWKGTL